MTDDYDDIGNVETTLEERVIDIEQRMILMRRRVDSIEALTREIVTMLKEMRAAVTGE